MFAEINRSESGNLPARPITIGENAFQGKIDRPQGFDTHQFLWVVKGSGRFWASGETRALGQGYGLFTRANVRHGYESAGGQFHTMWVTFTGAEALLDAYGVGDWMFFAAPDFLSSSTEQLERLCQNAATAMVRSAHTYTWAVELLESAVSARRNAARAGQSLFGAGIRQSAFAGGNCAICGHEPVCALPCICGRGGDHGNERSEPDSRAKGQALFALYGIANFTNR